MQAIVLPKDFSTSLVESVTGTSKALLTFLGLPLAGNRRYSHNVA